jgi:hypothetical protein
VITCPNRQRSLTVPLLITETVLCNFHNYNILMVFYCKCYYYTEKFYSVCYNDLCLCQKFTNLHEGAITVNAPEVIISTGISYHALPYRLLTRTHKIMTFILTL